MARYVMQLLAGAALAVGGCATSGTEAPVAPPQISAALETEPTVEAGANTAVIIPRSANDALVLGSGEAGGLEVYNLTGARVGAIPAGEAVGVDARYGVPGGAATNWTLAALDAQGGGGKLRLFDFDAASGTARELTARDIPVGFAGESLCLNRDARDNTLYAFALGGAGEIAQYAIFGANGRLDARLVRQLRVASEASYCTVDDSTGQLYVAEQGVGIWRFDADPEAEVVPTLIDAARLGRITEEAGGVAVYNGGAANYLIVSDASSSTFHLYDRSTDDTYAGSFTLGASTSGVDAVDNAGGLAAISLPLGARFAEGALLAMDDANDGASNFKLVSWADIADAAGLAASTPVDPRTPLTSNMAIVRPIAETPPVETDGDAADDPAIWVDHANPSRSTIIGTQKQSGLYVYDLQGNVVQFLPDGRMNNVDLRENFSLGGERVTLVTASNRTNDSIAIYRVDPATRHLINVADGVQPTGLGDPYGLCMYTSPRDGRQYVFINDTEGPMKQYELTDAGNGRVRATIVREFGFETQAEGCVADDETGVLYVAQEDVALWRMDAEPTGGDARTAVATVEGNEALKDDLEGIGLYNLGGGRGYLILSSQGNNTYAVFRREGANEYLGSFAVMANPDLGIDGSSETDGLEVTSASLGGPYAHGVFVAQDGRNISPPEHQNFKLVPWSAIAERLGLEQR